jgi:hypothetical protein
MLHSQMNIVLLFLQKKPLIRMCNRVNRMAFFYLFSMTIFLSIVSCCRCAPHKNDDYHLNIRLTPLDFIFQRIVAVPNNAFLQQVLRFGYTQSLFLFAVNHRLAELKRLPLEEKKRLLVARAIFSKAVEPFLVAFPVVNSVAGTTDLFEVLDTQRREYQMLRG